MLHCGSQPHGEMAERFKATVSKTVRPQKGLVSSNLTLSATTIPYREADGALSPRRNRLQGRFCCVIDPRVLMLFSMNNDEKSLTESFEIGGVLLVFFTVLFISSARISGEVYFELVCLSVLGACVVYFRDQIKEINLREMRVILEKTQSVKKEINTVVRELVRALATQSSFSSGSWVNRKQLNEKLSALLATAETPETEIELILSDARLMEKFMKDKRSLDEPEKARVDQIFSLTEEGPHALGRASKQ